MSRILRKKNERIETRYKQSVSQTNRDHLQSTDINVINNRYIVVDNRTTCGSLDL